MGEKYATLPAIGMGGSATGSAPRHRTKILSDDPGALEGL
jgi:hypothetical protein